MNTDLHRLPYYPFNLDGTLCPLLNNAELLSAFYAEESLRHGIKQFCKKTAWPGKPAISFAVDPAKLQELLLSLFNTPSARATLQRLAGAGRGTYLDNAMWQWLTVNNSALAERISGCCDDIKDKLFLKPESFQSFLVALQKDQPNADVVGQLAAIVLAFAMLQPDDRYDLGEAFLAVFPEYVKKFCGESS